MIHNVIHQHPLNKINSSVDDECSADSSQGIPIAVENPLQHKKRQQNLPARTTSRVSFDESRNVRHESAAADMSKMELLQLCWFTQAEMYLFKQRSLLMAKEIRFQTSRMTNPAIMAYSLALTTVYVACCQVEHESSPNEQASFLNSADQHNLSQCMAVSDCRLGLERICNRTINQDQRKRRRDIVLTVLIAQAEDPSTTACGCKDIDEHVREASRSVSLPSSLFARELAKAQQE